MDPSAYGQPGPPRYVMLSEVGNGTLQPPPGRRNLPRYYSRKTSSGGRACSCGCAALFCCCLLSLLLAFLLSLLFLFLAVDPKSPSYTVSHLQVAAFDVLPDLSLRTELRAGVRAENPNERIAIAYGEGGAVAVAYRGAPLCTGELPAFFQGHHNTTTIEVLLRGKSALGSGVQQALMESRRSGRIPLEVYVKVPVVLRLAGAVDLRKVTVSVMCSLVVDSLAPNQKVGIKSAQYKFNVEF